MSKEVQIKDKATLRGHANLIKNESDRIKEVKDSLSTALGSASNYETLDITGKSKQIVQDITTISENLEIISKNLDNYIQIMQKFDINDFASVTFASGTAYSSSYSGSSLFAGSGSSSTNSDKKSSSDEKSSSEKSSSDSKSTKSDTEDSNGAKVKDGGTTINVPSGLGKQKTYMGWQCITNKSSTQYKLRVQSGEHYDSEGFAKVGDRYVIATTTTFGKVGDYVDVYQADGSVIKCVIGDIKNQNDRNCNKWGHNNGQCVVEFVVDKKSWYGSPMHSNPGTSKCHPEWNQCVTKIVNKGNYFDNSSKK